MANLEEISEYKNTIMERLLTDDISKAVYYNSTGFLASSSLSDPTILLYTQIFPYLYVPDISTEAKTFITMRFWGFRLSKNNPAFKSGFIDINVVTHISLVKTDYGKLRYDYILNQIEELFNSERGIGIGKLEFDGYDDFRVSGCDFLGAGITYRPVDFN